MSHRVVAGTHAIKEVLKVRPRSLDKVWLRSDYERSHDLRDIYNEVKKYTKSIEIVSKQKLDKIYMGHQGAIVEVREKVELDFSELKNKEESLVILLDGIEDPHNLGAIVRSAWLMGADALYTLKSRTSGLNPTVHKVASGGVEYVPLGFVSQMHDIIKDLKEIGFWVYGLDERAEENLYGYDMAKKSAIVIGGEENGLKKATLKSCDVILSIPQAESGSSYNASVSASLAMAEYKRSQ